MKKTVALIQARMSSSRLPGKVLAPLDGVPMIVFMARRARQARQLDEVVVVTSTDASDDPLAEALRVHAVPFFRGDLNDVLRRFHDAAIQFGATEVVRLTGDCPLIDPAIVDAVVALRSQSGVDYSSNVDPPGFPDGFDVECFSRTALERAFQETTEQAHREHVTLWMRLDASGLQRRNLHSIADFSPIRLTVDYPDDLEVVQQVVQRCSAVRPDFDLFDVLRCLAREPQIMQMNPHMRNEALAKLAARK